MGTFCDVDCKKLKKIMKYGFVSVDPGKYEVCRYKGDASIVLYKTGKLLVQGKEETVKKTEKMLSFLGVIKPVKKVEKRETFFGKSIGSDETLKGDTFGGIVVCGFYCDDEIRRELREMNVRDSKMLNKAEIVDLARKLVERFPDGYHVENIFPKEYNKMNIDMNVTEILDKLHERCFKKLKKKGAIHIVDKYPGCKVGEIVEAKAEERFPEVAAASIIARFEALKQIRELEKRAGFFIPMGSTHVNNALLEMRKKSLRPVDFVKLKFKNVREFF